jgi:transcription antitermination factor NusG
MEAHGSRESDDRFNYGCVFCTTGREDDVAGYIRQQFSHIMALPAAQMKHKSVNGRKMHERCIMLPGYVFLRTESSILPIELYRTPGVLKILCEEERDWPLTTANRRFASWVYDNNGLIDISVAYRDGQVVRIVEGPLRTQRGNIIRIDKRNRNCLVKLSFNAAAINVWLAFDYLSSDP